MKDYELINKENWLGLKRTTAFYKIGKIKIPVYIVDVKFLFKTVQFKITPYQDSLYQGRTLGAQWVTRQKLIVFNDPDFDLLEEQLPEVFGKRLSKKRQQNRDERLIAETLRLATRKIE
jgi:hypothetical protein